MALAMFAMWAWRARLDAPYADDHDWMELAIRQGAVPGLDYLLEPHNAQHIVWARLLAWLGRKGGEGPVFLAAGVGTSLVAALALVTFPARLAPGGRFGATLGVIAALIVTETVAVQDAAWPVFSVYVFVAGFAALAFGLFEMRRRGRMADPLLLGALACAVAAGFGNAAGLAVWPVLVWSAWRSGERGPVLLAVAVMGVTACGFGLQGAVAGQGAQGSADELGHILKIARYFGAFCALPWAAGGPKVALQAAGWLIALVGAASCLGRADPEAGSSLPELGRSLIAFALITAVMASVGRVDELPQPIVPARYCVFADLLHVGLLFAAAPALARGWRLRPRTAEAMIAATCLALLAQQAAFGPKIVRAAGRLNAASAAFDRGDRSPDVVSLVYPPDPARAAAIRGELRRGR